MKKILTLLSTYIILGSPLGWAQKTFPVNGVADNRHVVYAFTNAILHVDYQTTIPNASLLVRDGKVLRGGAGLAVPDNAVVYDLEGKHIYPSFIDLVSGYGLAEPVKPEKTRFREPQFVSDTKGAFGWNAAIRPEQDAGKLFVADPKEAVRLRDAGFGTVMAHVRDGIARGAAVLASTGEGRENDLILKGKAAAWYSFDKGTSTQDYPGSLMGCIALLRQTFLDAQWYGAHGRDEEFNLSLKAWNENITLPQLFEVNDKFSLLRAARIGDEYGVKFVIYGAGDEYQRLNEIKKTGLPVIVPVNFPEGYDVTDAYEALNVTLQQLKHWESAPSNPARLAQANIPFALTSDKIKDKKEFLGQVRKAVHYGLDESLALKALTHTPAGLIGMQASLGGLRDGMVASFIITAGPVFSDEGAIVEHWVQGKQYPIEPLFPVDPRGRYSLTIEGVSPLPMTISGKKAAPGVSVRLDTSDVKGTLAYREGHYEIRFELPSGDGKGLYRLTGYDAGDTAGSLRGSALLPNGEEAAWLAVITGLLTDTAHHDSAKAEKPDAGTVYYPNKAYGFRQQPVAGAVLFRNATVWTNEAAGILRNTDVLIRKGKIEKVGASLDIKGIDGVEVVDATGMHLTAGIIDEHSHIAVSGPVNECTQAVTAEVRIGDVVDADDINIYRQLAGGVTTSHLLHGSCNPVGGQTQLIKLRWGKSPEEMKFEGWPGYIKFALGENVKQSNWGEHQQTRYPQTRMGVEQVYLDAFTRASEYDSLWKAYRAGKPRGIHPPRKDLELEALAEIINKKRFITCHSYRQSEINMLMHVADRFGFTVNTFTHILEGYKVADKMKAHGAGASSFSDWWAYKFEVYEAIPYNGALLHDQGVVVAYNSDDAEMARRLNQEAAKAVRYGGVPEEEAWKFVTLNPARLLRIDDRTGSVKAGKDADLVLWSDNPLSVYARALQTYVDGIRYYDEKSDLQQRELIAGERARLLGKMASEKKPGKGKAPARQDELIKHCIDEEVIQ